MKIGISKPRGFDPETFLTSAEWLEKIQLSEWDLLDLLDTGARARARILARLASTEHRIVISASSAYLFRSHDAQAERLEILSELSLTFRATAILLRISGFVETPWSPPAGVRLWFDSERVEKPATAQRSATKAEAVVDPLWHSPARLATARIYKVHGWHPTRWIRYYGALQLTQLARRCQRNAPEVVLFGHSMRNEEAINFRELLTRSCGPKRR